MIFVWWQLLIIIGMVFGCWGIKECWGDERLFFVVIFLMFIAVFGLIPLKSVPVKTYEIESSYSSKTITDNRIIFEFPDNSYQIQNTLDYFNADSVYTKKVYKISSLLDTTITYELYLKE